MEYKVNLSFLSRRPHSLTHSPTHSLTLIWSSEDDCYLAEMPELPGCIAHGETQGEALKQANIAAKAWLEVARQMERKIPKPIAENK